MLQAAGKSDQRKSVEPPLEKAIPEGAKKIDLVPPEALNLGSIPLVDAIRDRKSRRSFSKEPLSLEELSFLLWRHRGFARYTQSGSTRFASSRPVAVDIRSRRI